MEPSHGSQVPRTRWGPILLFLAAGVLVVSVGLTFAPLIPNSYRVVSQVGVIVSFLAAAVAFRSDRRLRPYWRLAFAYSTACGAIVLSGYTGDWTVALAGTTLDEPGGLAALKLGEDATVVGTIILLAFLTRDRLANLYVSRGRLRLGLAIGIPSFLVLTIIGLAAARAQGIPPDRLRHLSLLFVPVTLADGFTEELLFRGLLLKRIGRLVGSNWANVVTAAVFAFAHVQVQFSADLPTFLVAVFLLGLLWGWIMQKTDSWLAPALVHAGVDMLVIADFFVAQGTGI